jgi:transcriptional regulator with XRE-family HTH domain
MDLAMAAGVSPRHVSFLETGRSRPSRGMVLRLCEELQVPGAGKNSLLAAAGLSPAYESRNREDAELAPLREAVRYMLDSHAPYPAMALDRHWRLEEVNGPAGLLLGASGLSAGDSLLDALTGNETLRHLLVNLEEVEQHMLSRLKTELAHFGRDPVLEAAVRTLQARSDTSEGTLPAVIPARYRVQGQILSFFSTIAQFGSTGDLAMSELRVEMMFPADEATREVLAAMAAQ